MPKLVLRLSWRFGAPLCARYVDAIHQAGGIRATPSGRTEGKPPSGARATASTQKQGDGKRPRPLGGAGARPDADLGTEDTCCQIRGPKRSGATAFETVCAHFASPCCS